MSDICIQEHVFAFLADMQLINHQSAPVLYTCASHNTLAVCFGFKEFLAIILASDYVTETETFSKHTRPKTNLKSAQFKLHSSLIFRGSHGWYKTLKTHLT